MGVITFYVFRFSGPDYESAMFIDLYIGNNNSVRGRGSVLHTNMTARYSWQSWTDFWFLRNWRTIWLTRVQSTINRTVFGKNRVSFEVKTWESVGTSLYSDHHFPLKRLYSFFSLDVRFPLKWVTISEKVFSRNSRKIPPFSKKLGHVLFVGPHSTQHAHRYCRTKLFIFILKFLQIFHKYL